VIKANERISCRHYLTVLLLLIKKLSYFSFRNKTYSPIAKFIIFYYELLKSRHELRYKKESF